MARGRMLLSVAIVLAVLAVFWGAAGVAKVRDPSPADVRSASTEPPTATPTDTPTTAPTNTPTPTPTSTPTAVPTAAPANPGPSSNGGIARFVIPALGVNAPVEALGVDASNTMETPVEPYTDVGWYYEWTPPGSVGNAVFAAHVYWHSVPAPFNRIDALATGDEVDVVMTGGVTYRYEVISNNDYSLSTLQMGQVIWPSNRPADAQWITMITCAGGTAANGYTYDDRIVVQAQRVN